MDESMFWKLIDESRGKSGGSATNQAKVLVTKLKALRAMEIASFNRLFYGRIHRAYRNELWAAAYIIRGGCSDDSFEYFRAWLIGQGRAVYEAALKDPETLTMVVKKTAECEALLNAAWNAYEGKTGKELPKSAYPEGGPELRGSEWDEENLPKIYPKLWAKFGESPID